MDQPNKKKVFFSTKLSYSFQNFLNLRNTTQEAKNPNLKDHADE